MKAAAELLHKYPELALFITIFIGTLIGRIHFKGFGLGNVVGALLAGIVVGIFSKPEYPQLLRWSFFYLFLFSIGYSVGPQFFGSLRREAIPQIVLAVVLAITGLATTVIVALALGFDEGTTVGVLSGGLTQSAALGTGLNAIASLPLPDVEKATLSANAPLGDAITYGFGDLGLILFINLIGPMMMRVDLKKEATKLEAEMSGGKPPSSSLLVAHRFTFRGYEVSNRAIAGISIEKLEHDHEAGRMSVQRLKRGNEIVEVTPLSRIEIGDQLVVAAHRSELINAEREIGPEFLDLETLSVPMKTARVVITNRKFAGKTIYELASDSRLSRGVYLESLQRGEEILPREAGITLARGDVMQLVGSPQDVDRVAKWAGYVEADLAQTDLTFLSLGIVCGILFGLQKIYIKGMPLGLGMAGSILVVGLLAGWARSRYPVFGSMPDAAQRVLADIGLTVFIAIIGLQAGPHAVEAYYERGGAYFASIFFGGMIVTSVPPLVAIILARWILKMNPVMVLAGVTGAQTCTPALNALREASGSNIGALGYTVPYAIGNILLTLWGPIVVAIVYASRH